MNATTLVEVERDDSIVVTREAPDTYRVTVESADRMAVVVLRMSFADLRRLYATTADHLGEETA